MAGKYAYWTIAAASRYTRRRVVAGGLSSLGVGAALAAGCSSRRQPAAAGGSQTSGSKPRRGGVLNYAGGSAGDFDTKGIPFDPNILSAFEARALGLLYQRLVAYNLVTYATEPEIAQKWEQPSPTEYVFYLQPGVKWQNKPPASGRPLTTDDVVYSLERARTNDPRFVSRSLLAQIDTIEAPDTMTIRIATKTPDAGTLTKLSDDNLAIFAREVVEKDPKLNTAESAVGTGAFMMKSIEENVGSDYVRNPEYWKPGLPYLDGVQTKAFPDFLTAWSAFLSNQVDVALVPGSEVKNYIASRGAGYTPDWYADDTLGLMILPNTRQKPLDDPRVPRALRLLMDHDELITSWSDVQFGKGGYGSIFPTALKSWDLTDDEYRSHLEWKQPKDEAAKQAQALLSAAGFTPSNPLRFTMMGSSLAQTKPANELIQAQWKKFSQGAVDVQLSFPETAVGSSLRAKGQFSYYIGGFSVGMVEPDIWLSSVYHSKGSLNQMGFSDPQADAMIDKQRTIFDQKQREALVKQIVVYLIDHGPSTIGANRYFLYGVKPRVQNRKPEYFLNGHQYESVWLNA
jgi:peptide/nickel transport system substrate-binding protein